MLRFIKKNLHQTLQGIKKCARRQIIEFTLTGATETGILGDSIGGGDFGRGANSRLSF